MSEVNALCSPAAVSPEIVDLDTARIAKERGVNCWQCDCRNPILYAGELVICAECRCEVSDVHGDWRTVLGVKP